ncbi:hypothetical protein HGRIS_003617 [Hohenbuehelia grisea]|uniref:Uncharacterized protein n=1 Tax=Hohenbuehelia grisea TaxID=104357 RepID=A0ABR3JGM0_9AGAR
MDGDSVTVVDTPPAVELWDDPSSTAPSDTFSEAAYIPLITAFLSPMQFEDYDDDDEGEEESDYPLPSGSLSTPSTPNFLNFWMMPDLPFFRAGAATGRSVIIDTKVYILGETVFNQRTFAEKEAKICELTHEEDTVEACSAMVEEWPVDNDSVTVVNVAPAVNSFASTDSIPTIPTVVSILTPTPIVKAKKPATSISRKPLASLKNLSSFRGTLSKTPKATTPKPNPPPKTPITKFSAPTKAGTPCVPSTNAKAAPRSSSLRTLIKATTPTSAIKKSASLYSRSINSVKSLQAATKPDNIQPQTPSSHTTKFSTGRSKLSTKTSEKATSAPFKPHLSPCRATPVWR